MPIRVKVKLLGVFRGLAEIDQFSVETERPDVRSLIRSMIDYVSERGKSILMDLESNDLRPNALLLLNGREINVLKGLETEINDGDELVIIPVVHGG